MAFEGTDDIIFRALANGHYAGITTARVHSIDSNYGRFCVAPDHF